MMLPLTLEGRSAWLFGVAAMIASITGVAMVFRLGESGFQALFSAKILFPYSLLAASWTDSFMDFPIMFVILQFPVYAVVLTIGVVREKLRQTSGLLGIVHLVAVAVCVWAV